MRNLHYLISILLSVLGIFQVEVAQAGSCQDIFRMTARPIPQPPHFGTTVAWNSPVLWDKSALHSNDFFVRYGWDRASGSFASEISSEGKVLSDKRHLISTSRMVYGLAHSSSLDPSYHYYARRQAKFLLEKMTAQDQNGIYFRSTVDAKGHPVAPENKLVVNYQAYGLNGLVALYKVTKDPALLKKIEMIYGNFYKRFHDPVHLGFFDEFNQETGKPSNTKSYNSTVYVATSFLADLAELPTARKAHYVKTVEELADRVAQSFLDPKTGWIIENFTSDWKPDWRSWQSQGDATIGITGHNYQAAWFLLRATEFSEISQSKKAQYLESAKDILTSMLKSKSLDLENGGVFDAFKREVDEPMWHTNKAWWQQAEMILALTKADSVNLFIDANTAIQARQARDKAVQFYFDHFIDYQNGGEFPVVQKTGAPILTENKGQAGTGSYHQVELARMMKDYASHNFLRTPAPKSTATNSDQFDMNPAMRAAALGDVENIKKAEAAGVDLRSLNSNNASILYFAAQSPRNSVAVFEYIRKQIGDQAFESLLNQQVKSNGHSVALEAVFNTNAELVRYLLDLRNSGIKVDFESPTVFGWTPKTFAEREKLAFASLLPEGSVAVSERLQWMKTQEDLWALQLSAEAREFHQKGMGLISAIEKFDLQKIRDLVSSGVAVNQRYGRLGATPLNSSVRPGMTPADLEQAKSVQALLIELGANPNLAEGGIMMVPSGFRESVFGYADLIQNMIDRLPRESQERQDYLNFQGSINGYTKLIDASLRGRGEVIKALVRAGADRSLKGHNGMTAIEAARLYNSQSATPLPQEIMQVLEP